MNCIVLYYSPIRHLYLEFNILKTITVTKFVNSYISAIIDLFNYYSSINCRLLFVELSGKVDISIVKTCS